MTLEEFLENAKNGILEDRLDAFVPLDFFGPPTEAERPLARLAANVHSNANEDVGAISRPAGPGDPGAADRLPPPCQQLRPCVSATPAPVWWLAPIAAPVTM